MHIQIKYLFAWLLQSPYSESELIDLPRLSCLERSERRGAWLADDYFKAGERSYTWMGGAVTKYHRTVEDYFSGLQKADFAVESLRESRPYQENSVNSEEFERRSRIPLFIFFASQKV